MCPYAHCTALACGWRGPGQAVGLIASSTPIWQVLSTHLARRGRTDVNEPLGDGANRSNEAGIFMAVSAGNNGRDGCSTVTAPPGLAAGVCSPRRSPTSPSGWRLYYPGLNATSANALRAMCADHGALTVRCGNGAET